MTGTPPRGSIVDYHGDLYVVTGYLVGWLRTGLALRRWTAALDGDDTVIVVPVADVTQLETKTTT